MSDPAPRVVATPAAEALLATLVARHGPVMLHQSAGCCDGSVPMCYPRAEFHVGGQDVLLGMVSPDTPVWIGAASFEYWRHSAMTIDVEPGRASGMSLEGSDGVRFVAHARVISDDEALAWAALGEPPRGDQAGVS